MNASVAQPSVVVDGGELDRARRLAAQLGLELAADAAHGRRLRLVVGADRLSLALPDGPAVTVDFLGGPVARRGRGARDEALGQAIGVGRGVRTVVDATAGLGRDAFLLATLGCDVRAVERNPIVAALLADGVARAARHPAVAATVARIALVEGDAVAELATVAGAGGVDAVYLDPMFPERGKASLAKKDAQALQAIVGDAGDIEPLFAAARTAANKRVVVKRPRTAPPIAESVSFSRVGRSVRFDVYLVP